ncbi:uncharacterized protein TA11525 [Theileria annulata]|uniref:Mic1 domain-containing protein n=1 Tax=Theileria annulata TaxID=5874 RepID=Q4UDJ2_THEAN|nr:uncharacterized protein TA11525 [Theileria annulata]CAI74847.1 hypothetical protein TA11525 [Theileria annulata]|eukprot:XP_952579.1 hypothetical protein TA11525 [Theileria annulata]
MANILQFDDIFTWQSDSYRSVFVDRKNSFLIYQNAFDKSIRVIDAKNGKSVFSSNRFCKLRIINFRFDKQICESILVSSDRNFMLYWFNDPVTIGIHNMLNSDESDVLLDPSQYEDSIVLKVFWSDNENSINSNFVVICNNRVDVYNFSFESSLLRTLTRKSVSCSDAWNDLSGTYFILLHHNKSLNPYKITKNEIFQLPEIGITLAYGHQIQHYEICVATLYEGTYCIYKDVANGTLSLRSLTNNKIHDKVLEVNSQGWIEICVIDNLLIVLTGSGTCYVFDIAIKNDYLLAKVPQKKPPISSISSDIEAFIPNIVVDFYGGFAYYISLDFNTLSLYLSRYFTETMSVEFFQRRMKCRDRAMEIISTSIENRVQIKDLVSLSITVAEPYSETLKKLNKLKGNTGKGHPIPFNLIDKFIGDRSIITEHNFATSVLYPYVIRDWKLRHGVNLFDFSISLLCYHRNIGFQELMKAKEGVVIPRNCVNHFIVKSQILSESNEEVNFDMSNYLSYFDSAVSTEASPYSGTKTPTSQTNTHLSTNSLCETNNPESSPNSRNFSSELGFEDEVEPFYTSQKKDEVPELYRNKKTTYIIVVTLCYIKSLVFNRLHPSNMLLLFLFDICVLYNNLNLLTYMIRSRVVRDNFFICYRLYLLFRALNDDNIKQLSYDMSKRLKLYTITIKIILHDKQYYKALLLIKREKIDYPIYKILYLAANDVSEQKMRPYLWQLLISFILVWVEDHRNEPHKYTRPNLENCQMWLPDM